MPLAILPDYLMVAMAGPRGNHPNKASRPRNRSISTRWTSQVTSQTLAGCLGHGVANNNHGRRLFSFERKLLIHSSVEGHRLTEVDLGLLSFQGAAELALFSHSMLDLPLRLQQRFQSHFPLMATEHPRWKIQNKDPSRMPRDAAIRTIG